MLSEMLRDAGASPPAQTLSFLARPELPPMPRTCPEIFADLRTHVTTLMDFHR
jgi:hypothetical protein